MLKIVVEGFTMNLDKMKELKKLLWEYLGDVTMDEITISTDGEY